MNDNKMISCVYEIGQNPKLKPNILFSTVMSIDKLLVTYSMFVWGNQFSIVLILYNCTVTLHVDFTLFFQEAHLWRRIDSNPKITW